MADLHMTKVMNCLHLETTNQLLCQEEANLARLDGASYHDSCPPLHNLLNWKIPFCFLWGRSDQALLSPAAEKVS